MPAVPEIVLTFKSRLKAVLAHIPTIRLSPKLLIGAGIILFILLNTAIYIYHNDITDWFGKPRPAILTRKKPRPLNATGTISFTTSSGQNKTPQFTGGTLIPIDPSFGQNQTLQVKLKDPQGITEVFAAVKTDNQESTFSMSLKEGVATNGTWQGEWVVADSYNKNYVITFIAKNGTDQNSNIVTLR